MRQGMAHQSGSRLGDVVALIALALVAGGVSVGCRQPVGNTPATSDAGALNGSGGTSGVGGQSGHGGGAAAPAGGNGTGGHGGGAGLDGGLADAGGEVCTNLSGWTHPKPAGYDLPSYDGGVDGLCDAAASIGCGTDDFFAGEDVLCTPSYDACCFSYLQFEPEPCGWVDCPSDPNAPAPPICQSELAKKVKETKSPVCRFCVSDADCPEGSGQVCNTRIGDRMSCGPK
jgi:hypothetical protein